MFISEPTQTLPLDLRDMNMTNMDLTDNLSIIMTECKAMDQLVFSNLLIKGFPKTKQGIEEFKSVYFDCCQLDSFENFEKLFSNITELKITNSKMKNIPECITKMKNLKTLDFGGNNIENLRGYPKQLISTSLKTLNLSNNIIGYIPNDIKLVGNLQNLILNNCGLELFPSPICNLKHLKYLDLSNNRLLNIQSLEKSESLLEQLEELKMDNCNLKKKLTIPFKNLRKLSLKSNSLTHFPIWSLNTISPLSELDLSNNMIFKAKGFNHYPNLKLLTLKHNKIEILDDLFASLSHLKFVDVSHNLIGQLPSIASKQLVVLVLCHNKIKKIHNFCNLEELQNLDLSHNLIKNLPNCCALKSLKFLDISNNELETIEDSIFECSKISCLNISSNFIKELPSSIENLVRLKEFEFQANEIQKLPIEITKLESLLKIRATFNPCCRSFDSRITDWIKEKKISYNLKFPEVIKFMEGLFVGYDRHLRSKSYLKKIGITHVISIEIPNLTKNNFVSYFADINTSNSAFDVLVDCCDFIENSRKNGSCFIYCSDGKTVSGIILMAYVIYSMNVNYERALELIIPDFRINTEKNSFYAKLKHFEKYVKDLKRNSEFMKKKNEIEKIKMVKQKSISKTNEFQQDISKLNDDIKEIEEIIQIDEEDIQSFTFNIPDYIPEPDVEKKKKFKIFGESLSDLLERDLEYLPSIIEKYICMVEEIVKIDKKFDFYFGISDIDLEFQEWIETINTGGKPDIPAPCCYLELIRIFILKRIEPIFTFAYLPRFTSAISISNQDEKIFVLRELVLDLPPQNSLILYRLIQMFQNLIVHGNIDPNQIAMEFSIGMISKSAPLHCRFSMNHSSSTVSSSSQSESSSISPSSSSISILRSTMKKSSPSKSSPKLGFFKSVPGEDENGVRNLLSNSAIKNTWLLLIRYSNRIFENESFAYKKNQFHKELLNKRKQRKEEEEKNNASIEFQPSSYYISCLLIGNLSPLFTDENLKKQMKYMTPDNESNVLKVEENDRTIIKGATFEKLIAKLTHPFDNLDDSDIYVFLLTFRTFTDTVTLFDSLVDRYNTPPPKQNITTERFSHFYSAYLKLIRLRICQILYHWISKHYSDFEDIVLAERLRKFRIELSKTKMESPLKKIDHLLKEKKRKPTLMKKIDNPEETISMLNYISPKDFNQIFLDQKTEKIAEQLTLISFSLYKNVKATEFLDKIWSKNDVEIKETKAKNIINMSKRNDEVSLWMCSLIILENSLEVRAKLISKFIQIAEILLLHNNFDGLMQITAGLNNNAVYRLKKSWALVDQKILVKWKEITSLLENKGNFKAMRDLLKNCNPPCVPFLGIFLTDLTFIDDGNKDIIDGHKLMINFQKRRLFALTIKKLISFQQTTYAFFEEISLNKYLLDLPNVDKEIDYHKKSLEIEPRAKSMK
eukprot:gene9563-1766_t